jgi:hypothetical protein
MDPEGEPTFERLAALPLVLISFYTGLERIFERVARRIDYSVPHGSLRVFSMVYILMWI